MTTLVIAEHDNKTLKDATAKTVTAAAALGAPVHVLVAGEGADAVAAEAAKLTGVEKVLLADDAAYAKMLAEPMQALLLSLADRYDALLAPATTTGKNICRALPPNSMCSRSRKFCRSKAPDTFTRPIYAGNAIQTVQAAPGKKIITVRATAFKAAAEGGNAPRLRKLPPPAIPACQNLSAKNCPNPNARN